MFAFLRPYAPDLFGWFRTFGQVTANYDANGHYARVSPVVDAFQFTRTGENTATLKALDPSDRQTALEYARARRCPGAAAARPADNSAPYQPDNLECDAAAVPPGP